MSSRVRRCWARPRWDQAPTGHRLPLLFGAPRAPQHALKRSGLDQLHSWAWCPVTEFFRGAQGEASFRAALGLTVSHTQALLDVRVHRAQAGPVWEPCPQGCPPHACRRYFDTDTSSASEDEGSLQRPGQLASAPLQSRPSIEPWPDPAIQGSSTSSSASSTSSHPGGQPAATPSAAAALAGPAALARVGQYSCGDPSRQRSPRRSSDPPSPLCVENVLLVTSGFWCLCGLAAPDPGWASPGDLDNSCSFCSGGAAGTGGQSLAIRWPATCNTVFCSFLVCTASALSCPCTGCPKVGLGCSHEEPF